MVIIIVASIVFFIALILYIVGRYYFQYTNSVPVISLNGESVIELNLDDKYEEAGAKAYLKDRDITNKILIKGQVDTTNPGIYKLEYTIPELEMSLERVVYIRDNIPPTITLKGNKEIYIEVGEKYTDLGCIVEDNVDGNITNKVTITGEVNTKKIGTYEITYKVKDSSGNEAVQKRIVFVKKKKTEEDIFLNKNSDSATKNTMSDSNKNIKGIPILMYHFFYDESEKGKDNNWVKISDFEEQMKYLVRNDYYFPTWEELEEYIDGRRELPEKSVIITVDDGDESFLNLAIPIIEKYNVKVTSFVITGWNGDWVVQKYKSDKVKFGSHSHDMHKAGKDGKGKFLSVSNKEGLEDVKKSKDIINDTLTFCYPFGHYNSLTKKILKEAGYKIAVTTKSGKVYPGMDKYELPRVRISKGDSLKSFIEKLK
jgi:peptidoglycan/xylan/chitin deacetylase (PgdA/CDA1 family)